MVKENLEAVRQNILGACRRVGRSPDEVTLIAVSKTKPIDLLREAMACGAADLGENKVQELVAKREAIGGGVNWHFIGHLQRNKVKQVAGSVTLIHSVDSIRLAEQIEVECSKKNVIQDVLVEINMAEETTKFGTAQKDAGELVRQMASLRHVRVRGLMTVAPYVEDAEENRIHFRGLRKLLVDINAQNVDNVYMDVLSMGMSGDYEVAIEEGATMVRVGTGIFGVRSE